VGFKGLSVRRSLSLTGAACVFLVGCSGNPFGSAEGDYAKRVSLERLRHVQPSTIADYRRPEDPAPPDPQDARRRFEGVEKLELSLEEGRASALRNNLDLSVALVNPTIAAQEVSVEEARFESLFTLRAGYGHFDSPTASNLSSAQSRNLSLFPAVRIPTRTGGSVSVGLPMNRNENDNQFSTLNPAFSSDLEFSLSHQLLRGAGRRVDTAALRIAGYNLQATEAQTKLEVIRQLAAVDRSYWRLFQARRELEVAQQQYELAREQEGRAQRRTDAGLSPNIEVVRAQAGVADRLEAIIVAQNNVLLQQRELKRIINLPGLTLDTRTMVAPSTPPDPVEYVFDHEQLVAQALDNRMEMLELELRLAADAVNIAFARNQTLPLLALDYTYRINGLGGSSQDSFRTLQRNNFEDWELGLTAEIPLGNEAARAQLRSAILQRLQRLSTREARRLAITQEVLNAIDAIDAGWQRVLAARQSVILNRRALEGEQRQFDVGGSTSTNVLDAATRLAEAEFSEARALADYQIAQVDLAFATGTLLGAAKVAWEPTAVPEDRSTPAEDLPAALLPRP
jgi:outer membrane protein